MLRNNRKTIVLCAVTIGLLLLASRAYAPVIEFVIDKKCDYPDIEYTIDPTAIAGDTGDLKLDWRQFANYAVFYEDTYDIVSTGRSSRWDKDIGEFVPAGRSFEMKTGEAIKDLAREFITVGSSSPESWNNKISSFELGGCTYAILWEHKDYNGAALLYKNLEKYPIVIKKMSPGWDNRVSSISVKHEPSCKGFSLSGEWVGQSGGPSILILQAKSGDLTFYVPVLDQISPKAYQGRIKSVHEIDFRYSADCCTGQMDVDFMQINWSNNTQWTRSKTIEKAVFGSGTFRSGRHEFELSVDPRTGKMRYKRTRLNGIPPLELEAAVNCVGEYSPTAPKQSSVDW